MRERDVERRLRLLVEERGGMCVKLAPTVNGMPDRMVITPRGEILLVELKSPSGRLRPIQRVRHEQLASRGVEVAVLSTAREVEDWVGLAFLQE